MNTNHESTNQPDLSSLGQSTTTKPAKSKKFRESFDRDEPYSTALNSDELAEGSSFSKREGDEDHSLTEQQSQFCYPDVDVLVKYPNLDPIVHTQIQRGQEIQLRTYHMPVPQGKKRRGVVFYIHGYGSNIQREAVVADLLSKHGHFEVFAMDQRGYGKSGGIDQLIESTEDVLNDQWQMIFEVIKKFQIDQQTTPMFMWGRSFGGLIATKLVCSDLGKKMFRACALMTPFYRLADLESYKRLPLLKVVHSLHPFYEIPPADDDDPSEEYKAKWGHVLEIPYEPRKTTCRTVMVFDELQWTTLDELKECQMPFSVCRAEIDDSVNNPAIHQWMANSSNPLTKVTDYKDVDHSTIIYEPSTVSRIVKDAIDLFNQFIDDEEQNKTY